MNSQADGLPAGWEMLIDKATGWPFYVDHNTQTTHWHDPRKPPVQPSYNYGGGMPQPQRVREIPIGHTGPSMPSAPTAGFHGYRSTHSASPVREIPIMRGSSPGSRPSPGPRTNTAPAPTATWSNQPVDPPSSTYQPTPSAVPNQPQGQFQQIPVQKDPVPYDISKNSQAGEASTQSGEDKKATPAQPENQPSAQPPTLLQQVEGIYKAAEDLQQQVNGFPGAKGDRQYLYLEEMMTRLLIKLDNIDSEGREEIRNIRRAAVRCVQASIDQLELKALANDAPDPSAGSAQATEPAMDTSDTQSSQTNSYHNGKPAATNVKEMTLDSEINC